MELTQLTENKYCGEGPSSRDADEEAQDTVEFIDRTEGGSEGKEHLQDKPDQQSFTSPNPEIVHRKLLDC